MQAFQVKRDFGHQDFLGAGRDPHRQRQKPPVPAHHFNEKDPFVRGGGVADFVDRFHRGVDRGVEADGVVRAAHIIVDGFGNADDAGAGVAAEFRAPLSAIRCRPER